MSNGKFTLPQVAIRANEDFNIFVPGPDLNESDARALCAYLISGLRDPKITALQRVELAMSAFTLVNNDIANGLAGMSSLRVQGHGVTKDQAAAFIFASGAPVGELMRLHPNTKFSEESCGVTTVQGIFAALASILMASGRQGGTGPEAAAVKARPKALVDRFTISEDQQLLLPGRRLGMDTVTVDKLYSAFSTYTEPRAKLVLYMLALIQHENHFPTDLEILVTNFRLMRNAGMTHVGLITNLVNMHPWTVRVPELGPYFNKYVDDLEKFKTIPLEVREYHRLLVPQSQFLFLTPDLRPLIAVAGDFSKDVEAKFSGYVYNKAEYAALIATVRSYAPNTAAYIGPGQLAQKLGIQDMNLPTLVKKAATTDETLQ